eukprot:366183-Chlamydomonas_euryale.AAC.2
MRDHICYKQSAVWRELVDQPLRPYTNPAAECPAGAEGGGVLRAHQALASRGASQACSSSFSTSRSTAWLAVVAPMSSSCASGTKAPHLCGGDHKGRIRAKRLLAASGRFGAEAGETAATPATAAAATPRRCVSYARHECHTPPRAAIATGGARDSAQNHRSEFSRSAAEPCAAQGTVTAAVAAPAVAGDGARAGADREFTNNARGCAFGFGETDPADGAFPVAMLVSFPLKCTCEFALPVWTRGRRAAAARGAGVGAVAAREGTQAASPAYCIGLLLTRSRRRGRVDWRTVDVGGTSLA